jgi:hypothetical protein
MILMVIVVLVIVLAALEEQQKSVMDPREVLMHYRAARAYGRDSSCGGKQDYQTEEASNKAALSLSKKKNMPYEGYPCVWCNGWHVGRTLTQAERNLFYPTEQI